MSDENIDYAVRPARAGDRAAIEAMHRRCSLSTRTRRWHAPLPEIPRRYLADALSARWQHVALVAAENGSGRILALASIVAERPDIWEMGVLVVDDAQRFGIGTRLAGELLAEARRRGATSLRAELTTETRHLLRPLGRLGRLETSRSAHVISVRVDISIRPETLAHATIALEETCDTRPTQDPDRACPAGRRPVHTGADRRREQCGWSGVSRGGIPELGRPHRAHCDHPAPHR